MTFADINGNKHKENKNDGKGPWRYGTVTKSTYCSCRGPRFISQHPHVSSQPSLTSGPGDLRTSSDLCRLLHICDTFKYTQEHTIHKINTFPKKC